MTKLNELQQTLKVPKNQRNTFSNFNFRSCEDILEAVKPLLGKATLTLNDEIVRVGDRYYVKATVTLTDGTEIISASAYAREPLTKTKFDEAQVTGASSSYARKYALSGLFALDDEKDADTQENASPQPPKKIADVQKAEIKRLCDELVEGGVPLQTKEEYQTYVFDNTDLLLVEENYASIISKLKAMK